MTDEQRERIAIEVEHLDERFNDDSNFCGDCRDHCDYIDVCVECNEEECVCVDVVELNRMKRLYDAEVHYGIHVPEGAK